MSFILVCIAWCLLAVLAWPIAVIIALLLPFLWLLSLPVRALGIVVEAAFALLKALLFLPARILGYRG